ncbi:MAG: hypothetical protein M9894_00775 [Planctomycetes bacterium]|nr:hypothetical protein [Planctomycetota bacterium]
MTGRVAPLAALLLLLAAAAPAQDAPALAATEEALARRFAALREALEAELGGPFDPPPRFVPARRAEVARLIAAENEEVLGGLEGAPAGEELRRLCEQQGRALSDACFGKLHLAEGHVLIAGETFARLAALAPELAGLREAAFLDVILVHEAVHVWQDRRFGVRAFVGQPRDEEELRARFCVLEGHAQVVTRRVAERLGLADAFALLVRANSEVPSSVTDPVMRHVLDMLTQATGFQYVEGEKLVAATLERLGRDAGLERLFTAPPRTLRAVSHPEHYLAPPSDDLDLRALARAAAALLPAGWPSQVAPVPEPALRSGLALGGEDALAWLRDGHRESYAATASDPRGAGRQVTIVLLGCTSPEAAARMIDIEERVSRAKDEDFAQPGGAFVITSAEYAHPEVGDRPGLWADKRLRTPMGEVSVRTLVAVRGAVVVEAMSVHHPDLDRAALEDLVGKVLDLLPPARD